MDITLCRSLMGASLIIGRSDDRDEMVFLSMEDLPIHKYIVGS